MSKAGSSGQQHLQVRRRVAEEGRALHLGDVADDGLGQRDAGQRDVFLLEKGELRAGLGRGQAPGLPGGHVEKAARVDLRLVLADGQRAAALHDMTEGLGAARRLRGAAVGREGHEQLRELRAHGLVDQDDRRGARETRHRAVDVVARRDERVAGGDAGAGVAKKVRHDQGGVGRRN
jgi:hypothetical protein